MYRLLVTELSINEEKRVSFCVSGTVQTENAWH